MFKKGKRLAVLCTIIFVVLSMCMPCLADETQKTIRVGSFEDTFNYVDEHGARRGYGYELMQALAGYTGWKFEYVKCDWSNCFEKLENGEIGHYRSYETKKSTRISRCRRYGIYQ